MTREEADAYKTNWDSYGAEPPSRQTIEAGRQLVARAFELGCPPDRVVVGDGLAITYRNGKRSGDVETIEDEVFAAVSDGTKDGIKVWEAFSIDEAIRQVYEFCHGLI